MESYFGYKKCANCSNVSDDGAYVKEKWLCLDCADKRIDNLLKKQLEEDEYDKR